MQHGNLCRVRNQRGISLIELVATIVVLSLVSIPLSLLISEQIPGVFNAQDNTAAVNLARYEMELVKNLAYDSLASATTSNYLGYDYDIVRTVTFIYGNQFSAESLKQVVISVRPAGSANEIYRLGTWIARNVDYGI